MDAQFAEFLAILLRGVVAVEKMAADRVPPPDEEEPPTPTADRIYALVPSNFTLRWSDDFKTQPLGVVPSTEDYLDPKKYPPGAITQATLIAAKQDNARVDIVAVENSERVLELAVKDVQLRGNTGARGLVSGNNWGHMTWLLDQEVWLLWQIRFLKHIPVQQAEQSGFGAGIEGKMGNIGIWGTNLEVIGGQMLPWLQNSSGKWVYTAAEREPIPVGVWNSNALNMVMSPDKTKGWMRWHWGQRSVIEAMNVATIGEGGGIGLMPFDYAMGENSLLVNDEFPVQIRNVRIYVKTA